MPVMSIAEFYIENGIDPGDPDSFDAWMHDHAEFGSSDGAWRYAGERMAENYSAEAEEEELMMVWEEVKEEERGRLSKEHPELSRGANIEQAEAEADRVCLEEFGRLPEFRREEHLRATAQQQAARVQQDRADAQIQPTKLDASEIDYLAESRGWQVDEAGGTVVLGPCYTKGRGRLEFDLQLGSVVYINHSGKRYLKREVTMADVPALLADVGLLSGGPTLVCASCQFNLATADFTSNQRKKREARRCKVCVDISQGPSLQPVPSTLLASQSAAASSSDAPLPSSPTQLLLWRGLRADELPGLGLKPQAPTCTAGVHSALERGNDPNEFVHMTEDATTAVFFSAALNTQADPRIVLIDASKLSSSRVITLSSAEHCASHGIAAGSRGFHFACSHRIVLVQGDVPPEAIVAVRAPPSEVPRGLSAGSLQSFQDALTAAAKASIAGFNPRILGPHCEDGVPHMSDIVSLSFQHLWMYECAEITSAEQVLRFTILQTQYYEYFPGRFGSALFDELDHMISTRCRSPGDALATTACEWHMCTVISSFWHDSEPREEHTGFRGRRMYGNGPTPWVAAFIAGCTHLETKYTERQLVRCIRRACASATRALGLACSMSGDSKEGWPAVKDHEGLY